MPPRTRTRILSQTFSANDNDHGVQNVIQKAHDLVASTDTESIRELWEDLCRSYKVARHNDHNLEAFPYWILENIPHGVIPKMLDAKYGKGARAIEFYGPRLGTQFKVPLWQFVLFFGSLSQPKVTKLNAIARKRMGCSFDSFYRELERIRSKRGDFSDGPSEFTLADLRSYC